MKGYPWHQFKDHPRSRGDHFSSGGWLMVHEGSPPLTRGPRIDEATSVTGRRITPAHAGTTPAEALKTVGDKDHPRSRGDHPLLAS